MIKSTLFLFSLCLALPVFGMLKALNTAATGMATQEAFVNTISNNIANVNTTGFKKGRAESADLLYETVIEAGARASANSRYNVGLQVGSGSRISAVRKEFSQGSPQITKNPFDLMIDGQGFFGIILPNGEIRYTRDGAFNVDSQGNLVNKYGYRLYPGLTMVPNSMSVNISEDGKVDAYVRGQTQEINIGTIPIFTFINPAGLKSQGGNLYVVSTASGEAIENIPGQNNAGIVQQGALESSNVQIMNEMTNLIKAQRGYEMNSKVMGIADQILQTTNNIVR